MADTSALDPASGTGRYNAAAMTLHWVIAALILTNIGVAWYFNTLPRAAQIEPVQLHKSIGITVLVLSLTRLAWRFIKPPPREPAYLKGWERIAACSVYVLFYVFMIGMPLTGWALVSASPYIHAFPIRPFGLFEWPAIGPLTTLPPAQMHQTEEAFETAHGLLAKLAYALIVIHVGAALRHAFLLGDGILQRMVPFLPFPKARA